MRLFTLIAPALICGTLAMPVLTLPAFADDALISLTGTGEVSAKPDMAFVTSGVTTQGATAKEALDANTKAMNELMAVLKTAGIEDKDIQTSNFSVSPNYVYSDQRDANGYTLPPQINGYSVSNTVTVRVTKLDTLGAVLDQQVSVGANTVGSISFGVADTTDLYDEARKRAFADAERKANLYVTAAGEELGLIKSISEQQAYAPPQPYMMKATAAPLADSAPVPVAAGELSFTVDVNVTWTLAD